jgi:hypothetical protein
VGGGGAGSDDDRVVGPPGGRPLGSAVLCCVSKEPSSELFSPCSRLALATGGTNVGHPSVFDARGGRYGRSWSRSDC